MVIQIQDLEYKINEEKLSEELTKLLHRNLCKTPGISKDRFIDWDTEKWEKWFINYLEFLIGIFNQYKETHTDSVLNTINFVQNLYPSQITESIEKDISSECFSIPDKEDEKSVYGYWLDLLPWHSYSLP
jgi:hypothetical protein